jgi:hypothetical protein
VLAQQAIPASRDARDARPMAADADGSFADASALPFALTLRTGAFKRPALDGVRLADVECRPDNAAITIITGPLVHAAEFSPAGIVVTARPSRGRGTSWE